MACIPFQYPVLLTLCFVWSSWWNMTIQKSHGCFWVSKSSKGSIKWGNRYTCVAPSKLTRIQRRVLPLLTEPPSLVTNVCSLMLKVEWPTSKIFSNIKSRKVVFEMVEGIVWAYFIVYTFVVQGVLQLNVLSWVYSGISNLFKIKINNPLVFIWRNSESFVAHVLCVVFCQKWGLAANFLLNETK